MAIPKHELLKVEHVPEVKAAIEAFSEAHAASEAAWQAAQAAVRVSGQRRDDLEQAVAHALEAAGRPEPGEPTP